MEDSRGVTTHVTESFSEFVSRLDTRTLRDAPFDFHEMNAIVFSVKPAAIPT